MKYHIRRSEREIKDQQKLIKIIKEGKFAVLALCVKDEPYAVTMSYGFDEKNNGISKYLMKFCYCPVDMSALILPLQTTHCLSGNPLIFFLKLKSQARISVFLQKSGR